MRIHRKYGAFQFPRTADRVRDIVALRNLTAARIEPVLSGAAGGLLLDCIFEKDGSFAVVPFIEIATPMLDRRESSPFVWPEPVAACITHETAREIEDALLPWLESESFNRGLNAERLRFFGGDSARETFDRARALGFTGAAPYSVVFRMAAPYVYAARYARGKTVRSEDSQGAAGAAVLSATANVSASLGSADEEAFANRWFDTAVFGRTTASADLSIGGRAYAPVHIDLTGASGTRVHVAAPVPMDVTVSFDAADAPAVRSFGIVHPARQAPRMGLPAFAAGGGSSGRILLLLRDDFESAPDADSDAALILAARLRAEGFTVVTSAASLADPAGFDLVHCCCTLYPEQALPAVRKARALGIAVVLTESPGSRDAEASWGTAVIPQILRIAHDETILEDHLRLMAARKLEAPGAAIGQEPYPGYRDAQRELHGLALSSVSAHAAPFLPEPCEISAPPVDGGYVLVHGPLHPRCNQFAAVRAAAAAGVPIVVAGPAADSWYAHQVRAYAPAQAVFVGEPASREEMLGLYAGAKVYLAAAWTRLGEGRLALARAAGCAIATADAADHEAIAQAVRAAWDAPSPAPLLPQADPLTEVILAYSNCAPAGRNT